MIGFDDQSDYRYMSVDNVHMKLKAALHMLFHILGRYHEHQRPDQERHISIVKKNILEGRCICMCKCMFLSQILIYPNACLY